MTVVKKTAAVGVAAALALASFGVAPASADGKWRSERDAAIAAGAAGFAAGAIVGAAAQPNVYYAPRGAYVAPRGAYVAPRGVYVAPAPRVYYRPPAYTYRSDCDVRKVKAWDPVQRRNVTVRKRVVC
jgi:hypothetical protein